MQKIYQGRLSGGHSAAAHHVQLRFMDMGLEVRAGGAAAQNWAYEQIKSTTPIRPGEEVLIFVSSDPDARLHVTDLDFAGELLKYAPQISSHTAHKRILIPMFAATLAILAFAAYIWLSEANYAQNIARMLPDSLRDKLGRQVVASIIGSHKECSAKPGAAALERLVTRLNTGHNKRKFTVKVAELGVINAFAAPGENIMISSKLIKFAKSPEEVAGVLAHEMGHGIEIHPEAGIIRAFGISAGMSILLGGISDNIASIGSLLLQMNYSRKAEREADRHALRILRNAEINPKPLAVFFERVEVKMSGKTGNYARKALKIIGSHPATDERVKFIENAEKWQHKPALNTEEWKALQHICN